MSSLKAGQGVTMSLSGFGAWFPNTSAGSISGTSLPSQYAMTSTSATPDWQPPKPQLAVVRIVCWKCAKAEGKFLYQHGMGLTWCEECYVVIQLSVPTSTP